MSEIRCGSCSRKLGEGEYITLVIKCPRCGTLNHLRATRPISACHRASDYGETRASKSNHSLAGRKTPPG
ncbi:Com family DNA-binding transcriptional regulator [Collimonas fungivorans]|uniref:Com family DNA-binding transcriptional regulator n=1 Tax=Collimonas fungivorans TaxID=158899 RepID=UPI0009DA4978|nr:Com family DNA-binding transcriptional regulator [Collimonas fungivorans]